MSELSDSVIEQILTIINTPSADPDIKLNNGLRLLAKWRSLLIQNTLIEKMVIGFCKALSRV